MSYALDALMRHVLHALHALVPHMPCVLGALVPHNLNVLHALVFHMIRLPILPFVLFLFPCLIIFSFS